ncbi:hypothetical protein GALLR39Z86_18850 [Glycomyces algeriensis]|uniref:Uncharacterized protein n=1 Tax=Glycomyces algeriensis TaxID=256037 RepID=A0A9W6G6I0_9ACTN|nr:hypothetical protein GALLR39Z86_18850 [Glycomyces algeriensis]
MRRGLVVHVEAAGPFGPAAPKVRGRDAALRPGAGTRERSGTGGRRRKGVPGPHRIRDLPDRPPGAALRRAGPRGRDTPGLRSLCGPSQRPRPVAAPRPGTPAALGITRPLRPTGAPVQALGPKGRIRAN